MTNAASADDAIREALAADDTVSLFVQFADPDSRALRAGAQARRPCRAGDRPHHPAPGDRRQEDLLRAGDAGRERAVDQVGRKVVTACTPLVVFTGAPDRVQGEQARKDHADLIRTVADLKSGSLLPEEIALPALLKRTKELSATSTEKVLEATEQAREKAKPYTDKALETAKEASDQAKQAAERAAEAAKPYYDKSKEAAQKAYDDALKHRQGADGQVQAGRAEEELTL